MLAVTAATSPLKHEGWAKVCLAAKSTPHIWGRVSKVMLTSYSRGYVRQTEDLFQPLPRYSFYLAQQYRPGNAQGSACLSAAVSR
jgi:hypothetical protein